jgi:hypothetical protein
MGRRGCTGRGAHVDRACSFASTPGCLRSRWAARGRAGARSRGLAPRGGGSRDGAHGADDRPAFARDRHRRGRAQRDRRRRSVGWCGGPGRQRRLAGRPEDRHGPLRVASVEGACARRVSRRSRVRPAFGRGERRTRLERRGHPGGQRGRHRARARRPGGLDRRGRSPVDRRTRTGCDPLAAGQRRSFDARDRRRPRPRAPAVRLGGGHRRCPGAGCERPRRCDRSRRRRASRHAGRSAAGERDAQRAVASGPHGGGVRGERGGGRLVR